MVSLLEENIMRSSIYKIAFCLGVLFVSLSCEKQSPPPAQNNTTNAPNNNPANNNSGYHPDSLTATKWCLYQYRDENTTTPLLRSDTLVFIDSKNYTWNGIPQTYQLYTADNIYYKYVLRLNNTPFGTLSGFPPLTFKTYGEIIDEPFGQANGQTFRLWFKKIN